MQVEQIGKLEPEIPLTELEQAYERDDCFEWLAKASDASATPHTERRVSRRQNCSQFD
jgi:hypothetical protein